MRVVLVRERESQVAALRNCAARMDSRLPFVACGDADGASCSAIDKIINRALVRVCSVVPASAVTAQAHVDYERFIKLRSLLLDESYSVHKVVRAEAVRAVVLAACFDYD